MILRRHSIYAIFLTCALLLAGQASAAQHKIDHIWHETTEACQAFKQVENSAGVLIDVIMPPSKRLENPSVPEFYSLIDSGCVAAAHSRAPPR